MADGTVAKLQGENEEKTSRNMLHVTNIMFISLFILIPTRMYVENDTQPISLFVSWAVWMTVKVWLFWDKFYFRDLLFIFFPLSSDLLTSWRGILWDILEDPVVNISVTGLAVVTAGSKYHSRSWKCRP